MINISHHFDTPTGHEDPRLNLADFYLFDASLGRTVMAMTVNPEAAPGMAAPFRAEGLHVFRFDTDDDAREEVSFKVTFDWASQSDGQERQVQGVEIRRATGPDALRRRRRGTARQGHGRRLSPEAAAYWHSPG